MSNIFKNINNGVSYDDFNILNNKVNTLEEEHETFLDSTDFNTLNTEIQNNKDNILINSDNIADKVFKTGDTMTGDLIIERNTYQPTQLTLINNRNIQTANQDEISSSIKFKGDSLPLYTSPDPPNIEDIGMIAVKYKWVENENTDGGRNSYALSFQTYSQNDSGMTENMDLCRDGVHIKTGNLTIGDQYPTDNRIGRIVSLCNSTGATLGLGVNDSTGNIWEQEFNYVGNNSPSNSMNFQFRGKGIAQWFNNGNFGMIDGQIKNINDPTDQKDAVNLQTLNSRFEPYYFKGYLAFDNGVSSGQTYNLFNFSNMIYTNTQNNVINDKYVIPETGIYSFNVNLRFTSTNENIYGTINIYNASSTLLEEYVIFEDSGNTHNNIKSSSTTLYLTQGQQVDITGTINSNATISGSNSTTTRPTFFMINKI